MKIVIGVTEDDSGNDALAFGSALCRSLGADPLVVNIHPASYEHVSHGHVDAGWEQYQHKQGRAITDEAREKMARYGWDNVEVAVHGHRSSGHGLAEFAHEHHAEMIVIGSSPGGSAGRFHIGSTADQLLHGATKPVVLVPSGWRREAPERIGRVVVAFAQGDEGETALAYGVKLARLMGVPLKIMTILVRHRMFGSDLGADAEGDVLAASLHMLHEHQVHALTGLDTTGLEISHEVAVGDSPLAAMTRMDWGNDELMIASSARGGVLRRVFLGDMTYKIVRATPVATAVLPRRTD